MSGYLVDTNILSEIRKGPQRCDPTVWSWWIRMQNEDLWLSVLTLGEIRKGIERLRAKDSAQSLVLERWLEKVRDTYSDRLIPVCAGVADMWGRMQCMRAMPEIDALLAASARYHDLTLITMNESDFNGTGARVINPFVAGS